MKTVSTAGTLFYQGCTDHPESRPGCPDVIGGKLMYCYCYTDLCNVMEHMREEARTRTYGAATEIVSYPSLLMLYVSSLVALVLQ